MNDRYAFEPGACEIGELMAVADQTAERIRRLLVQWSRISDGGSISTGAMHLSVLSSSVDVNAELIKAGVAPGFSIDRVFFS